MRWLITGANGNLGQRLIRTLLSEDQNDGDGAQQVVAVVRSERAKAQLLKMAAAHEVDSGLEIRVLNYTDSAALGQAAEGCSHVVHLVGILKEARGADYVTAHEHSSSALLEALASTTVQHLTYLSIVGSHPSSSNACLASKGRAEQLLREHPLPVTVLRVPMVLGEGDYASFALRKRAQSGLSFGFRASSLEQPIYAGDVIAAIRAAARAQVDASVDLGGPEVLTRADLAKRAAAVLGKQTRMVSLPYALGHGMAWLMQNLLANPPVTTAMLGVLDHDDQVDSAAALQTLQLQQLTSLDDMLRAVLS